MSTETTAPGLQMVGLSELKRRWGFFVGMGAILVILGTIALGAAAMMTILSMLLIGWLMIFGGALEVVHAFSCRQWGGFFVDLFTGLLYLVVGFLIVANPTATALSLTLLMAMLLIFSGIFRVILSISVRYQHWGWMLLNGVVNLFLGFAIWKQWPTDALWVIGLFIGIDMIFNGWSLVMLGLAAKNMPVEEKK